MKTTDKILARYTSSRAFPTWEKGAVITVQAQAYHIQGNAHPHFAVTCDIITPASRRRNDIDAGGCMHEEILRFWPNLKPLVDLHLSNADNGEPMYALENGFYWMEGALDLPQPSHYGKRDKTPEQCLNILAEHLRISSETALELRVACQEAYDSGKASVATSEEVSERCQVEQQKAGKASAKLVFSQFVDSQRSRWQAEAQAGLALIESLNARQAARKAAGSLDSLFWRLSG